MKVRFRGPVQIMGAGSFNKGDEATMHPRDANPLIQCGAAVEISDEDVEFASGRAEEVAKELEIASDSLAPGEGSGKDGAYTVADLEGRM